MQSELYYWDTYFFNKGLSICNRMDLARNNTDNMLYLVNKYGYTDIAKRIAQKYVTLADRVFEKTNNLWEKYNVVDANLDVSNEYGIPPMMVCGSVFGIGRISDTKAYKGKAMF